MGKYSNVSGNRSSGCPYNGNRGCSPVNRQSENPSCPASAQIDRSANSCTEISQSSRCPGESRLRGCEGENPNRAASCRSRSEYSYAPAREYREGDCRADSACAAENTEICCENEYSRAFADAACGYVWRGTENRVQSCAEEYDRCPARLHVHEAQGSVQTACERCAPHTHRFACVTCEPILLRDGRHAHSLTFRTDSFDGHCHEFSGMTTGEYEICGSHIHYIEGETDRQAGHCHAFRLVTQLENLMES